MYINDYIINIMYCWNNCCCCINNQKKQLLIKKTTIFIVRLIYSNKDIRTDELFFCINIPSNVLHFKFLLFFFFACLVCMHMYCYLMLYISDIYILATSALLYRLSQDYNNNSSISRDV